MKGILCVFAAIILVFFQWTCALADGKEGLPVSNPSQEFIQFIKDLNNGVFTKKELAQMRDEIDKILIQEDSKEIKELLYKKNGIEIYFRGIYGYSDYFIIGLFVENQNSFDIKMEAKNAKINEKYVVPVSNGWEDIIANSIYFSVPNYDYIIDDKDVALYGITTINKLSFELVLMDCDYIDIDTLPVTITMSRKIK